MKRWTSWVAIAIVLAVLGGGVWRAISARQAQQQAHSAGAKQSTPATLTLQPSEVITLQARSWPLDLPISGVLHALQTAVVKARIAGELQGLHVREGDSVRAGQLLARIDPTETTARLRQAQQQAHAAQAQMHISQRQYDNNKALVEKGFISATALQTSADTLRGAQASHEAAQAGVDVLQKTLQDTQLHSPITGQIAQRLAQNGERVGVDTRVLEVVNLDHLELEALIAPSDAAQVRIGQQAQLSIEGSTLAIAAKVVRINPSTQAGSRATPVYLHVDTRSAGADHVLLRQGLFVQGVLHTGEQHMLAVPLHTVRIDKPQPYVQVIEQGRIAHRSVRTGARVQREDATWIGVQGLSEGAQLTVGALGLLREGTPVHIAPQPATPAAPATPSASAAH